MSDVRFGQGGIPDWLEPMVRFCSRCGTELQFGPIEGEERERLACPGCGFVFYVNPRLVVTTLPVTDRGEVVLIRRGIAPGHDRWAQPGLLVEPFRIVGLYSRVQAAVVVVAYEARIVGGEPLVTRESLETLAFAPEAIPWPDIAFETSIRALRDWVARVRPDLPLPDPSTIHRDFGA